jgi:hypothetical protein
MFRKEERGELRGGERERERVYKHAYTGLRLKA